MTDLARLARPFPAKYVKQLPGRGQADFVPHSVVTEALLAIVGPFDFEVVEIVRDGDGSIVGCLGRLEVSIDGRDTVITEVGDITGQEANGGAALKNAASDALKRCAMRIGLGLHLWAQGDYFLHDQLAKAEA